MSTFNRPMFDHMSREHGLTLLESELHEIIRLAKQEGIVSEPITQGFYWWRQTQQDAWRMVRVVDHSDGTGLPVLCAYDAEQFRFGGKTISVWKRHGPLGEWRAVERPGA